MESSKAAQLPRLNSSKRLWMFTIANKEGDKTAFMGFSHFLWFLIRRRRMEAPDFQSFETANILSDFPYAERDIWSVRRRDRMLVARFYTAEQIFTS